MLSIAVGAPGAAFGSIIACDRQRSEPASWFTRSRVCAIDLGSERHAVRQAADHADRGLAVDERLLHEVQLAEVRRDPLAALRDRGSAGSSSSMPGKRSQCRRGASARPSRTSSGRAARARRRGRRTARGDRQRGRVPPLRRPFTLFSIQNAVAVPAAVRRNCARVMPWRFACASASSAISFSVEPRFALSAAAATRRSKPASRGTGWSRPSWGRAAWRPPGRSRREHCPVRSRRSRGLARTVGGATGAPSPRAPC